MNETLLSRYDGLVCDLDGVVYAGPSAVPHAVEALEAAVAAGTRIVYATNNASRPPAQVAGHLVQLGLRCTTDAVVNSSMAGAYLLSEQSPDATVLAIGGAGVALALGEAGLTSVTPEQHRDGAGVDAVLQGYGPDVCAGDLAEAAYAIQAGARWVATNTDATLPTDRGRAPGNGSLVQAVALAVEVTPDVAGKPEPIMYELASQRMGLARERVLAVGDRLETDIEGAVTGGFASVLVLTGVHGWADAAAAEPARRPTYVLEDLRGLAQPYLVDDTEPTPGRPAGPEQLRAVLAVCWQQVDSGTWSAREAADHLTRIAGGLHE